MISVLNCQAGESLKSGDIVAIFNPMKGWAFPVSCYLCFKSTVPATSVSKYELAGSGRVQGDCEEGQQASVIQGTLPDWLTEKPMKEGTK